MKYLIYIALLVIGYYAGTHHMYSIVNDPNVVFEDELRRDELRKKNFNLESYSLLAMADVEKKLETIPGVENVNVAFSKGVIAIEVSDEAVVTREGAVAIIKKEWPSISIDDVHFVVFEKPAKK